MLSHQLRPGFVEVATIDHGLRAESAAEAEQVGRLCSKLDIPYATLPVSLTEGNIQKQARIARYAALAEWMEQRDLSLLATAHHADDQAETLLLRLNRGSGVAGLAGIRREGVVPGSKLRLIRPLLDWRKAELIRMLDAAGISYVNDPSNVDPSFDRARMRGKLAENDWLNVAAIADSARHLAEADEALDWFAQIEWDQRVRRIGSRYVYRPAAPRAVRMRVVVKVLTALGGSARGAAVSRLLDRLNCGEGGNIGGVLIRVIDDAWRFEAEPPRSRS